MISLFVIFEDRSIYRTDLENRPLDKLPVTSVYVGGIFIGNTDFPAVVGRYFGYFVTLNNKQTQEEVRSLLLEDDWEQVYAPSRGKKVSTPLDLLLNKSRLPEKTYPQIMQPKSTYDELNSYLHQKETAFLWIRGRRFTGLRIVDNRLHLGNGEQGGNFWVALADDVDTALEAIRGYKLSKSVVLGVENLRRASKSVQTDSLNFNEWLGLKRATD